MIGVFDSGYGGLAILKDLLKELPQYDYMYLGDNARIPYGNRNTRTLIAYTEQAVEYLFAQGCTLIIIACNTASEKVLRHLQAKYLREPGITNRKILGVIKPQVEAAIKVTTHGRIGVVATQSTIASKSFETELKKLWPPRESLHIATQACPLLVPLIEENWHKKPETKMILKKYLQNIKTHNIDTLILACTHYAFLYKDFQRIMGKKVRILNPGPLIAASLKNYLQRHPEIEKELSRAQGATTAARRIYQTTGDPKKFQQMGSEFLGQALKDVKQVELG